jgi:L-asparagine transporter-like permease
MGSEFALKLWDLSECPVKYISWSPHRAAVFYVLDEHNVLYIWDLLEQDNQFLYSYNVMDAVGGGNTDETVASVVITPAPSPCLLFIFTTGRIISHQLKPDLHEPIVDESAQLKSYISTLA